MNKKFFILIILFSLLILLSIFYLELDFKNSESDEEDPNDPFKDLEGDPDEPEDPENPNNIPSSSTNPSVSGSAIATNPNQDPLTLEETTLANIAECQLVQGLAYYVHSNGEVSCALPNTPEGNSYTSQGYTTLISLEIKQIVTCLTNGLNANISPEDIICE
tara:strand:+ start:14 stop:499 length:486 start_codon:yes stop_codon:yes gene_type:complete